MPTNSIHRFGRQIIVAALAATLASSAVHAGDGVLKKLVGSWSGEGRVSFSDGQEEAITCRAYYRDRNGGLGMSLRCASTSYKVEIRSNLDSSGAGELTGSWEERTFNANGSVTGRATETNISLKVEGGGLSGQMDVDYAGSKHDVKIATEGTKLKSVDVRLARLE